MDILSCAQCIFKGVPISQNGMEHLETTKHIIMWVLTPVSDLLTQYIIRQNSTSATYLLVPTPF